MGGLHRLRRATLVSHLQPGHAVGKVRCGGPFYPPLRARAWPCSAEVHPRAMENECRRASRLRCSHRPRLTGAGGGPRRGAGAHAGAVRGDSRIEREEPDQKQKPGPEPRIWCGIWCARRGSNPQPLASEASTLSIELRARKGPKHNSFGCRRPLRGK